MPTEYSRPVSVSNFGSLDHSWQDRQPRHLPPLFSDTMAASTESNSADKANGAAEEPEPEPDDASSSPPAASYDPSIYQRPHPDDRTGGGGGGKKGAAGTKTDGKTKGKAKDKKDDGGHRCANCDKPGATKKCGRCGVEWYCDRNCQKVRWRWW